MCTAICYNNFFGRNLDYEISYGENIIITPRNYCLKFKNESEKTSHFAIIGMGMIENNYPLYYDAINEKGLGVAGLLFPENAVYKEINKNKENIAPFEFIPWILSDCKTVSDAKEKLKNVNITDVHFSDKLKNTPMHWLISDKEKSIVAEPTKVGLKVYENPAKVLTNSPDFPYHFFNLNNYMSLSCENPKNTFSKNLNLSSYSRGMGGIGLPGDLSSMARFVRTSFFMENSFLNKTEAISHVFHILSSAEQPKGANKAGDGFEFTIYSSCADLDNGVYYYKTYSNSRIRGVDIRRENLEDEKLISYSSSDEEDILILNN